VNFFAAAELKHEFIVARLLHGRELGSRCLELWMKFEAEEIVSRFFWMVPSLA
jgi:hypothetical protein